MTLHMTIVARLVVAIHALKVAESKMLIEMSVQVLFMGEHLSTLVASQVFLIFFDVFQAFVHIQMYGMFKFPFAFLT